MAYRFKSKETVPNGVRRIARGQIEHALGEIADSDLDRHETVHQVRKRCKKVRGLIRLVRPVFADAYRSENAAFRDAARELSYVRDAQSIIETFDKLAGRFTDDEDFGRYTPVRDVLVARRRTIADDVVGLEKKLEGFAASMTQAKHRVDDWTFDANDFAAVQGGMRKTYARARRAMPLAYRDPTVMNFHEWRKRVKYHWYHMRLLRRLWSAEMAVRCDAADALGELLGDDHDLAVLAETVWREPGEFGSEEQVPAFLRLVELRRHELQAEARPLGERLFAEKPKLFTKRMRPYWKTWKRR